MSSPNQYRRSRKLINPGLQLRFSGAFAGVALLAMLLQFLVLGFLLINSAQTIDGGGGELADQVPGTLLQVFGISMVVLLPLFVAFGVVLTHRFAGPVYRFEQYLAQIASGTAEGPCKIRTGDELQSLCAAINKATEPLRQGEKPADAEGVERTAA